MTPEKPIRIVERRWTAYTHEDGSRIIDLEFFYSELSETQTVAAVYGLSPEAVAIGVIAQKTERSIPMSDYINTLIEPINPFPLEEGTTYN
jgi:hypothetical protein